MEEVRQQYERWIYPQPIEDLEKWQEDQGHVAGDPRDCGDLYWPASGYRDDITILVAGCGANQAARYAFQHRRALVTGIDLSAASLAHEEKLKTRHGLDNLDLKRMSLLNVEELGQKFDFIACSGVLHHMPDPVAGLRALGRVLDRDGVIYVMLYGRYGRAAVYMMQDLFRILGATEQSDSDLALVKQTIAALPPTHQLRSYAKRSTDMNFDAGLVDLFLHKQDRPFTVGEVLKLTGDAGLAFQGWIEPMRYNPDGGVPDAHPLYRRLDVLSDEDRWRAIELIGGQHTRHDFCVCRTDRPESAYRIDFRDAGFPDRAIPLVPRSSLVPAAGGRPAQLTGKNLPPLTLPPALVTLFQRIDGSRTIRQCLESSGLDLPGDTLMRRGLHFYRALWRTGHILIRLTDAK